MSVRTRKIKKRRLLWSYTAEIPFTDELRIKIIETACVIAIGYFHLEEAENAQIWKNRALLGFKRYKANFINSLKCIDNASRNDENNDFLLYTADSYSSERFRKLKELGEDYAVSVSMVPYIQ